jgi:hypothetical protein
VAKNKTGNREIVERWSQGTELVVAQDGGDYRSEAATKAESQNECTDRLGIFTSIQHFIASIRYSHILNKLTGSLVAIPIVVL